jgi:hypothetical protein
VDTTVQEKAIAFPTDARLYHKARRALVRVAKAAGVKLRQTYARASKHVLFRQSRYRYAAAQQMKRAQRETRKLRVLLGRVICQGRDRKSAKCRIEKSTFRHLKSPSKPVLESGDHGMVTSLSASVATATSTWVGAARLSSPARRLSLRRKLSPLMLIVAD